MDWHRNCRSRWREDVLCRIKKNTASCPRINHIFIRMYYNVIDFLKGRIWRQCAEVYQFYGYGGLASLLGTRRCCDVESTSLTLIQLRNNVECPVASPPFTARNSDCNLMFYSIGIRRQLPANRRRWANAGMILGQRPQYHASIGQFLLFARGGGVNGATIKTLGWCWISGICLHSTVLLRKAKRQYLLTCKLAVTAFGLCTTELLQSPCYPFIHYSRD